MATTTRTRSLRPALTMPVRTRDHVLGRDDAQVTLVEYGDYQCPQCRNAHWIMRDVQAHVGERMRRAFRNFPLTQAHPDAQRAAEAAEAAGAQGKFWEMHDYLFEHQARLDRAALAGGAAGVGLNMARFERDIKSHAFAPRVYGDFLSGIRSGVSGTPTVFINGVRHDGAWDPETLTAAILAAAEERWRWRAPAHCPASPLRG